MDWITQTYQAFFGSDVLVAPGYLIVCLVIAYLIWRFRHPAQGFWAWVAPSTVWQHRSTRLDLVLFAVGRLMVLLGVVTKFVAAPLVAAWVAARLPGPVFEGADLSPLALAFWFWIVGDLATYWSHRAHHSLRTLWPLHAVHHSAEVLTPFTAYRQHPLGILVSASIQSVLGGAILGLIVGAFDPNATLVEIAGANAFLVAANLAMANFHHSHIWISFGPVLERIIISPAQHQIHHSTKPAHFNKNYGHTLAIWDWMFGTLYLIREVEDVRFGLDAKADAPLMTHRLSTVLIDPIRRMISPR